MALGVIPPLCATLGPVLVGPEGCSRGRWRSGPSKWCHTAAPEGRVREHHAPVGALRRDENRRPPSMTDCQGAPRTCRCIETPRMLSSSTVRTCQGAPRTCRCIETSVQHRFGVLVEGQGAPRTCRCIETSDIPGVVPSSSRQGAPRTCRCIETEDFFLGGLRPSDVREHHAPVGALRPRLGHCPARR